MVDAPRLAAVQWIRAALMVALGMSGTVVAEHRNIVPLGAKVTNLFSGDGDSEEAIQVRADLLRQLQETAAIARSYEQATTDGQPERLQPMLQGKRRELATLRQNLAHRKATARTEARRGTAKSDEAETGQPDLLDERITRLENRLADLQRAKTDSSRRSALANVKSLLKSYQMRVPERTAPAVDTPGVDAPGWSMQPIVTPPEKPTEHKPAYMTRGFKSAQAVQPGTDGAAVTSHSANHIPAQGTRGA